MANDVTQALVRGFLIGAAGFLGFALAPLPRGPLRTIDGVLFVTGLALFIAGMLGAALREHRAGTEPAAQGARIENLLVLVLWSVAFFGYSYARLGVVPDQFTGRDTRIDALYFTVATLATVGYGDVHATGQAARLVVTAHIVFTAVFVALAFRVLVHAVSRRRPR